MLFRSDAAATHPAWSPDGRQIAFDARLAGKSIIYLVGVESGAARPLTVNEANSVAPTWSSDGNYVYFGSERNDAWQVWKASATDGNSVQVTRQGGYEARESSDGKFLYYNKAGYNTIGLFRMPVSGGAETRVFDLINLLSVRDWCLTDKGVYFVHRYDEMNKAVAHPSIQFFDFASSQISEAAPLPHDPIADPGLSVSPDGSWLYYSIDDSRNYDIMLIENFR